MLPDDPAPLATALAPNAAERRARARSDLRMGLPVVLEGEGRAAVAAAVETLVADPASDLATPMKGPFAAEREGSGALHRAAIALAKEARLLPAALVAPVPAGGAGSAALRGLTVLRLPGDAAPEAGAAFREVVQARLPMEVAGAGKLHVFRPDDGGEEHYAIEV